VPPTYRVYYFPNGAISGGSPEDSSDYEESATVTVLGNTGPLARTGYYFRGWNTAADGSGARYAAGQSVTMPGADLILYAEWHTLFAWVTG
jgi:uncharacterized repeat protein (TIGR02543 family)